MSYLTAQELIDRYANIDALAQYAGPLDQAAVTGALLRLTIEGGDRSAYSAEEQAAADDAKARIDKMISIAESKVDGYLLGGKYTTPLTDVPESIKQDTEAIAVYHLAADRSTEGVKMAYDDAIKHLDAVSKGTVRLSADAEGDAAETHSAGTAEFQNDGKVFDRDDGGFIAG